jgi:hypothetical protein
MQHLKLLEQLFKVKCIHRECQLAEKTQGHMKCLDLDKGQPGGLR